MTQQTLSPKATLELFSYTLRNTEIKQTTPSAHNLNHTQMCAGYLCGYALAQHMYGVEAVEAVKNNAPFDNSVWSYGSIPLTSYEANRPPEWAKYVRPSLIWLNDTAQLSFAEIADLIDAGEIFPDMKADDYIAFTKRHPARDGFFHAPATQVVYLTEHSEMDRSNFVIVPVDSVPLDLVAAE